MKGERMLAVARSVGRAFIECFLPQFCIVCETAIVAGGKVCSDCTRVFRPEPVLFCPLCRFEDEAGAGEDGCSRADGSHDFVTGRAATRAGAEILGVVHRFKYSCEKELASLLAGLMVDSNMIDDELRGFDLMCPVPLFRTRLRERGFNQSAEIAGRLETHFGVPLITDLLSRTRPTDAQARLSAGLRRRNLLGSFVVTRPGVVVGKKIILVDDVITTGSTIAACVEALKTSGVAGVLVVAIAA